MSAVRGRGCEVVKWLAGLALLLAVLQIAPFGVAAQNSASAAPTTDLPPLVPARHFAARDPFQSPQLSPNGQRVSFLRDIGGQNEIALADPATGQSFRSVLIPDGATIISYRWVTDQAIFIRARARFRDKNRLYTGTRLYMANPDDGRVHQMVDDPFLSTFATAIWLDRNGRSALIAHPHRKGEDYPSVYRYDLQSGRMIEQVQPKIEGIRRWQSDSAGVLRLGIGWYKGRQKVWYRRAAADEMTLIGDFDREDPRAIYGTATLEAGSDQGYVMKRKTARSSGGMMGLYLYDFAKMTAVKAIYENPRRDVDGIVLHGKKLAGALYTDDTRNTVWLDTDLKGLYAQLKSALGGGGTRVTLEGRSKDNQRMLVRAGSESDPGVLYFLDRSRSNMSELAQLRPQLDFRQLAQPKPMSYTARDGTKIHGYLTLPKGREATGLPLIITPHGGPYGVRDTLRYDDSIQFLANRGYAVIQPNFRGSGGYGQAFYDLGVGAIGRGMQDDLDDAMDWAVGEGIADPERVCVIGGSYGGYAAMWAVLRNPERYACAASWAGVSDFDAILRHDNGFLTRYDRKRFRERVKGEGNFNLSSVSAVRFAPRLKRPLLLAHGTRDGIVPFEHFEKMVDASKNAPVPPTQLIVQNSGHSFRNERDQELWFDALDAFLVQHNPADQLDAEGNLRLAPDTQLESMFKPLIIEKSTNAP